MYNNANCKCKQLDIKYSSLSTYIACEGKFCGVTKTVSSEINIIKIMRCNI